MTTYFSHQKLFYEEKNSAYGRHLISKNNGDRSGGHTDRRTNVQELQRKYN